MKNIGSMSSFLYTQFTLFIKYLLHLLDLIYNIHINNELHYKTMMRHVMERNRRNRGNKENTCLLKTISSCEIVFF